MSKSLGHTRWAIPEGYIPAESHGPPPQMISHEAACLLNASDREAHVRITIFFSDREPVGPYRLTVPARRTRHVRFNDLADPEPIPRDTDYASLIEFGRADCGSAHAARFAAIRKRLVEHHGVRRWPVNDRFGTQAKRRERVVQRVSRLLRRRTGGRTPQIKAAQAAALVLLVRYPNVALPPRQGRGGE